MATLDGGFETVGEVMGNWGQILGVLGMVGGALGGVRQGVGGEEGKEERLQTLVRIPVDVVGDGVDGLKVGEEGGGGGTVDGG